MIDKLVLLSSDISPDLLSIAKHWGKPFGGYKHAFDFRKRRQMQLPVKIHAWGVWTSVHKVEILDVAQLGFKRTWEIVERVFPKVDHPRIYRIDLAVDVPNFTVRFFMDNCFCENAVNTRYYFSRDGFSFYPRMTRKKALIIYDRRKKLKKEHAKDRTILVPDGLLTRVEEQLSGKQVPFTMLRGLKKYLEYYPFADLKFRRLRISDQWRPSRRLIADGLRSQVRKIGLRGMLKLHTTQQAASILGRYFEPMKAVGRPRLRSRYRQSLENWFNR